MEEFKKQWLPRIFIGGCAGAACCLLLGFVSQPGSLFGATLTWDIRDFTFCYNSRVPELLGTALAFLLWFLFGAEVGVATLPFADSGKPLVLRTAAHFAVTALTLSAWVLLNFGPQELPFFFAPFILVYLLIWLGRWVGWYAEVAAIREKLGLAPGPSLFHWKETLPYLGFALLLCGALPLALRLCDAPDVPVLTGLLLPYLLLPVGGFMSGLSLGRRHGFCPLYPMACALFFVPTVFLLMNYTALPHCLMVGVPALAGNAAGAARRGMKRKVGRPKKRPGKEEVP